MDLFAAPFRNVGHAPLDRPQVDLQQGPAERSARSLRAADFFFEACFAKTVETPSPPNARSSFRKLLRTFATAPNFALARSLSANQGREIAQNRNIDPRDSVVKDLTASHVGRAQLAGRTLR